MNEFNYIKKQIKWWKNFLPMSNEAKEMKEMFLEDLNVMDFDIADTLDSIKFYLDKAYESLAMSKEDYMEKMSKDYGEKFNNENYYAFLCGDLEGNLNLIKKKIEKLESNNDEDEGDEDESD